MPADPDKRLHANRALSVPVAGGPVNCYSRTDILEGRTPAAWGSTQSASISVGGEQKDDPDTWTKNWYAKGRALRVPKAVVLSSHPQWTLYWPACYFYMPRDVIGDDGFGQLGEYYYLDQWNALDTTTLVPPDYTWAGLFDDASSSDPQYLNQASWDQFSFLNSGDKRTVYNARSACEATDQDGSGHCQDVPAWLLNLCPTPPANERYQQQVGFVTNPYYSLHPKLLKAFIDAKAILEADKKDPIYVSIPNWMPRTLVQTRNASLSRSHERLNPAHGGAVNFEPCGMIDSIPCYTYAPVCWAPPYPDANSPAYRMGFDGPTVPWLMSPDPGLGTNALHIYVGHPNMAFSATSIDMDYQAWPFTPEAQWILGPVYGGTYTGSALAAFAGRRPIWRAFGFDYGYANHGAQGLWDARYGAIVGPAADAYKANFWKYRNYGTRIFTYDAKWDFSWQFNNLMQDRRNNCPSTQFYFGSETFADFSAIYDTVDNSVSDCAQSGPEHLKFSETSNYFPQLSDIQRAELVGTLLTRRVMDYYNGNDPGSADFFQIALRETGLAAYNASYEGTIPGALYDAGGVVDYVRAYFAANK